MSREEYLKTIWLKACQLCARQEKAPSQVIAKLLHYGASEDEAKDLLERLKSEGFVDEDRFARAYVSDKFRFNKWGRVKLIYNLRQIGIDEATIEEALYTLNEAVYEKTALDLAKAKFRRLSPAPSKLAAEAKTIDFLRTKGFEYDIARKVTAKLSIPEQ